MPSQAPNAKAVTAQLERILSSADFNASRRLKSFLRFVVTETLKGNAGQIKAYTIAVTVFGRTHSFDPQTDPVVRIEAGKLRSKLEHFYYARAGKEPIRIDIPKGGYIPTFETLLPDALSGETPEVSDQYESPADFSASPLADMDAAAPLPQAEAPQPAASIAVLPFVNLSRDGRMDSFIDGLAEEIAVGLTRFEDMFIASSYSARQFKEQPSASVCEIADALSVRFVLHGSVQTEGDFVRVCAALTQTDNGADIWAQRFDGNSANASLFSIQEDITQKVVAQLGDRFGPIHRVLLKEFHQGTAGSHSPREAALCYQRWVTCLDPGLFTEAKTALEEAMERYPDSAATLALLSGIYSSDYQLGFDSVPDALNRALTMAKNAQRLDINCQNAYWSEALVHYLRRDLAQFRRTIEQVLPLNPANPFMVVAVSLLLGLSGQISRAVEMTNRAIRLSPYSPRWYHIIPFINHYMDEEYELALNEALQINTPTCFWDPLLRAAVYGQLGRRSEARAAYAELLQIQPAFVQRRDKLMQGMFLSDPMLKSVLGGLRAAGLLPTAL